MLQLIENSSNRSSNYRSSTVFRHMYEKDSSLWESQLCGGSQCDLRSIHVQQTLEILHTSSCCHQDDWLCKILSFWSSRTLINEMEDSLILLIRHRNFLTEYPVFRNMYEKDSSPWKSQLWWIAMRFKIRYCTQPLATKKINCVKNHRNYGKPYWCHFFSECSVSDRNIQFSMTRPYKSG